MPIATTEWYPAMLDRVSAGDDALRAVNVSSSETLNTALHGFARAGSDGIRTSHDPRSWGREAEAAMAARVTAAYGQLGSVGGSGLR